MKNRCYIITTQGTSVIVGTTMFIDGDILYVYDGEDLAGLFRMDEVREAHKTTEKT